MRPFSLLLLSLALAACGQKKPPPPAPALGDGGTGMTLRATSLSHNHLASCDDPGCGNGMNPPLGGDHCPTWLNCRVFDSAQPKCNWIHNLEHGGMVIVYHCDQCDSLIQQLKDYQAAHTDTLVTPDPELPDVVAVMVWGFGWIGNGFNQAAFDEVASHQGAESPEHIACSP